MQPVSRLRRCVAALWLFGAVALWFAPAAWGEEAPQPASEAGPAAAAAPALPTAAELLEVAKDVAAHVVYLRELDFVKEPDIELVDRATLQKVLLADFEKDMPPDRLRAAEKSFIKLGLLPEGFDLKRAFMAIMTEQMAGGYDPRAKKLYLVNAWSLPVQRFILSHEIAHVLQDQHHDVLSMPLSEEHNDDLSLATRALLEGEAMLASTKYLEMLPLGERLGMLMRMGAEGFVGSGSLTGMTASLSGAPPYLREMLLFPYFQGTLFVALVRTVGGWEGVSRLYEQMPASTEQLMHPMQNLQARDEPTLVELPDQSEKLPGWSLLTHNVLGEFGVRTLFRSVALPADSKAAAAWRAEAERAAAGWDGDRYQGYERAADGRVAIAWLSTWDTSEDAREFFNAYRRLVQARYAEAAEVPGEPQNDPEWSRVIWSLPDESQLSLERSASDVLIIDGFGADQTHTVRDALLHGVRKSPFIWPPKPAGAAAPAVN